MSAEECIPKKGKSKGQRHNTNTDTEKSGEDPKDTLTQLDQSQGEDENDNEGDQEENSTASTTTDLNHTNMSNLLILASQLEATNSLLDSKLQAIDEQLSAKQDQISGMEAQVNELQAQLNKLNQAENEEGGGADGTNDETMAHAAEIETQIKIYEQLKADEKAFKRNCNTELERLTTMLEQTKKQADDENIPDAELQVQLEKAEGKVEAGKEELGNINRKLALIQRQIEQIPHRVELREYRLRFTELYNQVSATHRQTKQYFSLYNSLEDSKRYLEKEHSLLNSIIDSYQEAGSTAQGREEFLKQLSHIHDGMKETCLKVDRRFKSEKVVVDKLQHDLQHLLDQKVNYEKCLKELDADCRLNERLLNQLQQIEHEEQVKAAAAASASSPL